MLEEQVDKPADGSIQPIGGFMPELVYVLIYVEGGNIQSIGASHPNVRVCVIDEDNIDVGDDRPDENNASDYDFPVDPIALPSGAEQEEADDEHPAAAQ